MDQVLIKDLLIRGVIGVTDRERENPQDILVNIVIFADIRHAGQTDNVDDSVNYRTVAKKVFAFVETAARYTVEALATDIAAICLGEPHVHGVRVRVEKPGAVRFSRSVGVEIERFRDEEAGKPHKVFVLLGSNINPEENLPAAVARLKEVSEVEKVSSIWETEPVGGPGPNFLNMAAWLTTRMDAETFKWQILRVIESKMGRERTEDKNAPRTIDLDVIVYDQQVIDPRLWELAFQAVPLAELYPTLIEPKSGRSLREIARELQAKTNTHKRTDQQITNA
jgi:2-amino-4-hydroxy-6-hydroxymethyldihydropteridine diphosphokinase